MPSRGRAPRPDAWSSIPQMYAVAQAMYTFAQETGEFKDVARTDGPDAWPNPKKIRL